MNYCCKVLPAWARVIHGVHEFVATSSSDAGASTSGPRAPADRRRERHRATRSAARGSRPPHARRTTSRTACRQLCTWQHDTTAILSHRTRPSHGFYSSRPTTLPSSTDGCTGFPLWTPTYDGAEFTASVTVFCRV